jgi:putative membrane protein
MRDLTSQQEGVEPDARFTFANDRTFLAWNRTAVALVVAGFAITQLLPPSPGIPGGGPPHIVGVPLIVLGIILSLTSYRQWARNQRALRLGRPLPPRTCPAIPHIAGGRRRRDRCGARADHPGSPPVSGGGRRITGSDVATRLEDMEDIDPAVPRERTVLAWSRTGLSSLALGGIPVRVDPLAGLTVLALGGVVWVLGYFHHRSMWATAGPARWLTRPRVLRLIAVGTAFVALVALSSWSCGTGPRPSHGGGAGQSAPGSRSTAC